MVEPFEEHLNDVLGRLPPETRQALHAQELLSAQIASQLGHFMRVRQALVWLLVGNAALAFVNAWMLWRR